jgi:hypothetical protein
MKQRAVFLLINLPIWVVVLSFTYAIGVDRYYNQAEMFVDRGIPYLISYSLEIIIWVFTGFYLFYSFLVPKYLVKGKNKQFWGLSAAYVVLGGPLLIVTLQELNNLIFSLPSTFHSFSSVPNMFIFGFVIWMGITLMLGFLGSLFRLASNSFLNIQRITELENQNLLNEIRALKSKLNPHFLFNTLNNIDTLIQTKPKLASAALSKLSEIMRYVVYETEKELIPIEEEIENIQRYIDLEKIRLVNADAIKFSSSIQRSSYIPPMIFFPFIENGFKHSNLNKQNHQLKISISEENNKLLFNCSNTISDEVANSRNSGVGLELSRKRLELLYPGRFILQIKQDNNEFKVSLQIDLSK